MYGEGLYMRSNPKASFRSVVDRQLAQNSISSLAPDRHRPEDQVNEELPFLVDDDVSR